MTTEAKTELMQAIEKLMISGTFSAEAVKSVADLTDKAAKMEERLRALNVTNETLRRDVLTAERQVTSLDDKIAKLEKEIADLRAKVEAGREDKYTARQASAVADAYKDALHTVFRPNAVREHVQRSVPIATEAPTYGGMSSGGSMVQNYQTSETITREEGV